MGKPQYLLLTAAVLTASLLSGCELNLGDSKSKPDAAVGKTSCLEIRDCIRKQCSSTTPDPDCVARCTGAGTSEAQSTYRALSSCLIHACCTAQGGCGGDGVKCTSTGTPQCESCTCRAQCDSESPCREAATRCLGGKPNCTSCV